MKNTPLDSAFSKMSSDPESDLLRLQFYERFAEAELFLVLCEDAKEDTAKPLILDMNNEQFALVFDTEDRLAEFAEKPTPYLTLSGRRIARQLAGQNIGIGLNLGDAPSSTMISSETIDWLNENLSNDVSETQARPKIFSAPKNIPENLLTAIDAKLSNMSGVISAAYLAEVTYENNSKGSILAILDAPNYAQTGITEAIAEALQFSGVDAATLDVTFLSSGDSVVRHLDSVAIKFEIPELILPKAPAPKPPGSDPNKPPKLR